MGVITSAVIRTTNDNTEYTITAAEVEQVTYSEFSAWIQAKVRTQQVPLNGTIEEMQGHRRTEIVIRRAKK